MDPLSDEDREVEEILQQSNRLMERRQTNQSMQMVPPEETDTDERMKELQRQKLELLSIQQPSMSRIEDESAVLIGDQSRWRPNPLNETSFIKNT